MNIYITKNNAQTGPFSLQEVNRQLASGFINGADLAFYEGCSQWISVAQIPGLVVPPVGVPPPVGGGGSGNSPLQELVSAAVKWIPRLASNPTQSVRKLAEEKSDRDIFWLAVVMNTLGTVVIIVLAAFKFSGQEFGGQGIALFKINAFSNLLKAVALAATPFVSLGLSNVALYKTLLPNMKREYGRGFIEAAAALLPLQIALGFCLLVGIGNMELAIAASAYAVIMTTLVTYELPARDGGEKTGVILLVTPLKIFLAAYITKVILAELFAKSF